MAVRIVKSCRGQLDAILNRPHAVADLETEIPQMVQHLTEQCRRRLSRFLAIEEHDVDVGIGSQFPLAIASQRDQATVLSPCDLRLLPGLPHGIPVPVDDQSVHELCQGRHDFGPRGPVQ